MELDVIKVSNMIFDAIEALSREGKRSIALIKAKAETSSEYDKQLAVEVATLKAKGEAVSVIDRLAKGNVSKQLHNKIIAEESLKAHYLTLERLQAQMNGLQSVNRYLESVSRKESNGQ